MTEIQTCNIQKYSNDYKNIFKGVYNDFKNKAYSDYKFELEPLEYEDFISSIESGLIDCLILFEDQIPTAFMVYTTEISESLELNLIHCIGTENLNTKRRMLMDKFMEINKDIIKEKVITYPMLGTQDQFTPEITNYGFKLIGLAVERLKFGNLKSIDLLRNFKPKDIPEGYKVVEWNSKYKDDVINVIYTSFGETSDALFDPRFTSIEGCKDILDKITNDIYGRFLANCSCILLHNKKPVGICLANITAGRIANIPLIGIGKEHCSKGLGEIMLHTVINKLINKHLSNLDEVNASTETDNYPALKMYRRLGFKEDYYYPQAYRPISTN